MSTSRNDWKEIRDSLDLEWDSVHTLRDLLGKVEHSCIPYRVPEIDSEDI